MTKPRLPRLFPERSDPLVLVALAAVTGVALCLNAPRTYDFFDMSMFMDAGYRVLVGQNIYDDFFYVAGPVHLWVHALFFKVFGFGKTAILAELVAQNTLVTSVAYWLARRTLCTPPSVLLALLCAATFSGPTSHPWYDETAGLFVVAALPLLEGIGDEDRSRRGLALGFASGALAALGLLAKSNVGLAGGVALAAGLLAASRARRLLAAFAGGGFLVFCATVLALAAPEAFVRQVFFELPAHRFGDLERLFYVLLLTSHGPLLLVLAVLALLGGRGFLGQHRRDFALAAGLLAASFVSVWTGSRLPVASKTFLGFVVLYLARLTVHFGKGPRGSVAHRLFWFTRGLVALVVLTLLVFTVRQSVELLTWTWRGAGWQGDYVMRAAPFSGWQASKATGAPVDEIVRYFERNVRRSDSLFVFPDCTVLYGLTGHEPYRKTPFNFTLYQSPTPRLHGEFLRHFYAEPPRWVVFRRSYDTQLTPAQPLLDWLGIEPFLRKNYRKVFTTGEFEVLRAEGG